jgi:hypothetical protein
MAFTAVNVAYREKARYAPIRYGSPSQSSRTNHWHKGTCRSLPPDRGQLEWQHCSFRAHGAGAPAPPGSGAQPRPLRRDDLRHRRVLTFTVDGNQIDVGPGQALCIPRRAVHRFDNNESWAAKVLCVITPAAIGPEYFREAFSVLNASAGGPPHRAKMAEIMRRHGLTPAGPQT